MVTTLEIVITEALIGHMIGFWIAITDGAEKTEYICLESFNSKRSIYADSW